MDPSRDSPIEESACTLKKCQDHEKPKTFLEKLTVAGIGRWL